MSSFSAKTTQYTTACFDFDSWQLATAVTAGQNTDLNSCRDSFYETKRRLSFLLLQAPDTQDKCHAGQYTQKNRFRALGGGRGK